MIFLEHVRQLIRRMGIAGAHQVIGTTQNQTGRYQLAVDWVREADMDVQRRWNDWTFHNVESEIVVPAESHFIDENTPGWFGDLARINQQALYGRTQNHRSRICYEDWPVFRHTRGTQQPQITAGVPQAMSMDQSGRIHFRHASRDAWILNMTGHIKPVSLINDNQEPLIPDEYQDIILHKAAMKYAVYEEAEYLRSTHEKAYEELLQQLESTCLPHEDRTNLSSDEAPIVVTPQ